jgi:hypothetical protein
VVTFYELKDFICRVFGDRQNEVDDGDVTGIVQTISRSHYSNVRFVLKNDELKNIFDRVNIAQTQGLDLYVDSKYEVAVNLDRSILRQELPQISVDEENDIEYEISLCSIEYCIFLLIQLMEKCKQENGGRVLLPARFRRRYAYPVGNEDIGQELDWKQCLVGLVREYSIKINSSDYSSFEKMRKKKDAYIFEFIYKTRKNIGEYAEIEQILPVLEMRRKTRSFPNTVEIIPRREYISDVIDYYKLACSSIDPYIQYISFYHIMEYFYDEIYKRKLVADLTDKITHPDFSYKDEDKVYEIATFVKNRMHMNDESGQGNELESLKYVLKEYVQIENLKNKLNVLDKDLIVFYQNNKVAFCKAPIIPWNDAGGVYTQLAKRIYFTRNSLVHSKSGKNKERYKPYKDEKELQKEIPLVRMIAEMIIINSSKIV